MMAEKKFLIVFIRIRLNELKRWYEAKWLPGYLIIFVEATNKTNKEDLNSQPFPLKKMRILKRHRVYTNVTN